MEGTVTIALASGAFEGDYTVRADPTEAGKRLRPVNGARWKGALSPVRSFPVRVRPPSSALDQLLFHQAEGSYAFARKRFDVALNHFREWMRLAPGNLSASNAVGEALMHLRRVQEAIAVLAPANEDRRSVGTFIPINLAAAFLMADRRPDAQRALRRHASGPVLDEQLRAAESIAAQLKRP
jgi:hypothetical protein